MMREYNSPSEPDYVSYQLTNYVPLPSQEIQPYNPRSGEPPSVVVSISDIYSFRSSLEIMSCISFVSVFVFTPDGFYIEQVNDGKTKAAVLSFKKKNLLKYSYNVRDSEGNLLKEYMLPIVPSKFVKSTKTDGKKEILLFNVYVNSVSLYSSGIVIVRSRSFEAVDTIPPEDLSEMPHHVYDYYSQYFAANKIDPASKKSAEDFVSILKILKVKGIRLAFCRDFTGKFTVKRESNEGTVILLSEVEDNTGIANVSDIVLNSQSIEMLLKLYKMGPKNVVRIYLEPRTPLCIVLPIGSYGMCAISLGDDPP